MIDNVNDIAAYYNSDPEREHFRLERHQLEFDLTWRYLMEYLPAQASILEIGAATGRYTLELAMLGYSITAVDMSETLLDQCRQSIIERGVEKQVKFMFADARNLNEVKEAGFNAVLLMGPLYHLVEEGDRVKALKEAYGRLRQGGLLFSSFISRYGVLSDLLKDVPGWIEDQARVRSHLERGRRPDNAPREGFRGYFVTSPEIAPLHEEIGFDTITIAAVEPAISAEDDSYNRLQGKQRQLWLDLFYEISTERTIIGASRHMLYIGRKK
jgi:S-adenosylmethionine-dependent methyltransferase